MQSYQRKQATPIRSKGRSPGGQKREKKSKGPIYRWPQKKENPPKATGTVPENESHMGGGKAMKNWTIQEKDDLVGETKRGYSGL